MIYVLAYCILHPVCSSSFWCIKGLCSSSVTRNDVKIFTTRQRRLASHICIITLYFVCILYIGVIFSGIASVETICLVLASLLYNALYPLMRTVYPGMCFHVMATSLIVPLIL